MITTRAIRLDELNPSIRKELESPDLLKELEKKILEESKNLEEDNNKIASWEDSFI